MSTTTATVYLRPRAATARSTATGAVVFLPLRSVTGLYAAGSLTSTSKKKNWKPSALHPLVDKNGLIDPAWNRYFSDLGVRKLGGAGYPTLPDVANFVTKTQVDSLLSAAQDQMAQANAQTLASLLQIVKAAGLAGAAQVPQPVLVRQETNPQPVAAPFVEGGGGAGAGE